MRQVIYILVFVSWVGVTWGQKIVKVNKYKEMQLADYAFENKNYYTAIKLYLNAATRKIDPAKVFDRLGQCYQEVRDYPNAAEWYKKNVPKGESEFPMSRFNYAHMLQRQGKYREAIKELKRFKTSYRGYNPSRIKKRAGDMMVSCEIALALMSDTAQVYIKHAGKQINSANSDFAPMPVSNDSLIYSSLRSDSLEVVKKNKQEPQSIKLYSVKRKGLSWGKSTELEGGFFNRENAHTANGAFSHDKKRFYFTRCERNGQGELKCKLYLSRLEGKQWSQGSKLPDIVNQIGANTTQPTLWKHYQKGKDLLYFASDRSGGRGGYDLWFTVINDETEYSSPRNLGRKINTENDEKTPFYDAMSGVLYFSSDGHQTFGGLDIMKAEGAGNNWTSPENMGVPLNTSLDDFYYVLSEKEGEGYFVSNRPGGIAPKGETCCDDIYQFRWTNILNLAVTGMVFEEFEKINIGIRDVEVFLFVTGSEEEYNMVLQSQGQTAMIANEHVNDHGYFFRLGAENIHLGPDLYYVLIGKKEGFLNAFARISTLGFRESDTLRVDLFMKRIGANKTFRLEDIYYDFNKATLREKSVYELENLVGLLNANPSIIVEIGSHTDNKGSDAYNVRLSQKRAESVVRYLIKKKIPPARLKAKGYGEHQPIATNTNPDGTDDPAGRQMNRRTMFKIIGEIEGVRIGK